jgi:hypothetical protein
VLSNVKNSYILVFPLHPLEIFTIILRNMKKIILLAVLSATCSLTQAQLLKKLKDKVVNAATGKGETSTSTSSSSGSDQSGSSGGGGNHTPTNHGGAGLKNSTPPDVMQQMTDAETANQGGNYSDARFAVQQALMGVEIEIGHEILKNLPATSAKLPKDTMQDKVVSTQWGWNNMYIERTYTDQKDKQVKLTIGNNILYAGLANAYFNTAYMQQNDAESPKAKQVKVKNNKAIITYEDSKGYTLIMPMGQTSMMVWECVNFADENEVIATAAAFDIDGIKKMMGEK